MKSLIEIGVEKPRGGTDVGDHPPITPTRSSSERELGGNFIVYNYIARHFFATISPDCSYEKVKVVWRVGPEKFTSSTVEVKREGYTIILPQEAVHTTVTAASPEKGQSYPVKSCNLNEGETCPPDHLTESELITLMEKNGIGTDASIPVHINNICEHNFCRISGHNRMLVPTLLGISLIHGISRIDSQLSGKRKRALLLCNMIDILGPVVRSQVEKYLDSIAKGEASFEAVVKHTLNIFVDKFMFFREHISRMDELFEASFSSIATTAGMSKPLSKCGKCRHYMRLIQKQPMRLFCATCNETYNLPASGAIKLFQEKTCPLDGFELVLWRGGTGDMVKSYPVCPMCYNFPPMEGYTGKGMACTNCTIPTCEHSLVKTVVMGCNEDKCEGSVILDPVSFPKWKMNCNMCNYCVFLPEGAKKISLHSDEKCNDCGTTIMTVDFNKKTTPLQDGSTLYKGCPLCDSTINDQCKEGHTKVNFARRKNFKKGRQGGNKKRQDPKLTFNGF